MSNTWSVIHDYLPAQFKIKPLNQSADGGGVRRGGGRSGVAEDSAQRLLDSVATKPNDVIETILEFDFLLQKLEKRPLSPLLNLCSNSIKEEKTVTPFV